MMRTLPALVLAALLAVPALAGARPPPPGELDPATAAELHRLRTSIAARQLDRTLDLTPEQARRLLPLVDQARTLREARQARREARARQATAALRAIDAALARGEEPPADARATLEELRESRGPVPELRAQMDELRARIAAVLTPEQRERLSTFRPGPGPDGRRGPPPGERGLGPADGDDERPAMRPGDRRGRHGRRGGGLGAIVASDAFRALLEARAR